MHFSNTRWFFIVLMIGAFVGSAACAGSMTYDDPTAGRIPTIQLGFLRSGISEWGGNGNGYSSCGCQADY